MNTLANNDWQMVRTIFDDALRQSPKERAQFVRQACRKNAALQTEVESLLASFDSAESFLETPAVVQIVENIPPDENLLSHGQVLGHYEIGDLIGTGGMGEVYLARDILLNRKVAIKLLRQSFLPGAQAKQRLLREARTAALLEHPNICQIYEIAETSDHCFIVMPYVVGRTLADILAKRPLGAAASLDLGMQIADGLAEAHSHGIIHRDIKPANIIVNDKGQVKILDFGLAKFLETETNIETSARLTTSGAVIGTVPFMSPEQLRGELADERTDIFSFGVLLYEMLGGKPAFTRNSNAETISAILNDEPDWSLVPAALKPTLEKCLAKDKASRYKSVRALADDLTEARKDLTDDALTPAATQRGRENAETNPTTPKKRQFYFWQSGENELSSLSSEADTASRPVKRRFFGLVPLISVSAAALLLGLIAIVLWQQKRTAQIPEQGNLGLVQLASWKSASGDRAKQYQISHNGKMIAYSSSRHGGIDNIFVKQTSGSEDVQVTKDSWANVSPLWSPDDQQIAYVSFRHEQSGIYVSRFLGGDVSPVLITASGNMTLRHWSRDGSSIYYERLGNLYRVDLTSHEFVKVTPFEENEFDSAQSDFDVSPDESRLVFCADRDGQTDIWTIPIAGGDMSRVTNDKDSEESPLWSSDSKEIIYNVTRNDFVQINKTSVDGLSNPIQVTRGVGHYRLIGITDDDSKVYFSSEERRSDIANIDLQSKTETEVAAESDVEMWPAVSPDGKSIVYQSTSSPDPAEKIPNLGLITKGPDGKKQQLPGTGYSPRWLPDSRHIAIFRNNKENPDDYELWIIDSVTGEEKRLTHEDVASPSYTTMPIVPGEGAVDFSSDGKHFVYLDWEKTRNAKLGSIDDEEVTPITDNKDPNVRFYTPLFSPNGKQIAIVSAEEFREKSTRLNWRLLMIENGRVRVIFSSESRIRILNWTPAGNLIFSTLDGPNTDVILISTAGKPSKIVSLTDVYMDTLTLSMDGKTLAYTARRNDRDDIWIMPLLAAKEPTRITNNSNSRQFLTNLAFGADGKSIYFDKQEELNTISVFENFN